MNVHIASSPLCRAAYTERTLKTAMLTGTEQYVILGAGMDTFAFHEKEFLAKHNVFEMDHPLTQADKKERIASAGWTVPENLTFVPVDFTRDSLTQRLTADGFDMTAKSFFSWLGVTYYLSAEAIGKTLAELSSLCADGSTLVFDYPDENFFDAPERRVQNTIMMAKAGGEPVQSAFFSAIVAYYLIHEGAHLLYAVCAGVFKQIKFMGVGVQVDVYAERMTDTQLVIFCLVGALATFYVGALLTLSAKKICKAKSKLLRAVAYYITIAFLLLDPLYLSVLCVFFGGANRAGNSCDRIICLRL